MSMIIGRNEKWHKCNHPGCHNESPKVRDYGSGQEASRDCDKNARNAGWWVSFTDSKALCPEHKN